MRGKREEQVVPARRAWFGVCGEWELAKFLHVKSTRAAHTQFGGKLKCVKWTFSNIEIKKQTRGKIVTAATNGVRVFFSHFFCEKCSKFQHDFHTVFSKALREINKYYTRWQDSPSPSPCSRRRSRRWQCTSSRRLLYHPLQRRRPPS